MTTHLTGRLLVASPALEDPNFHRTVVLVLAHGEQGALGVVLNRPTEVGVDDLMPAWQQLATEPPVIFNGGPVSRDSLLCLGEVVGPAAADADAVVGQVATLDLHRSPEEVAPTVSGLRIFSGYAGWMPGQLESELVESSWFVLDADAGDPLSAEADGLWAEVLRRNGERFALYAKAPPQLRMN